MAAELYKNRLVIWRPQPKQAAFMRRSEDEALYGGAAGGGKSDALVIEALRQVDIPHYRGLIVRKTYPQLSELIDKTMQYYKPVFPKARYNASSHVWTFPSGAKIYFGSMFRTQDKYNYQGKAFDFIGVDELTHFTWEEYSYLMSRNRPTGPGTAVYMRATANPGGIGHGWVKARFITPAPPGTRMVQLVDVKKPDGSVEKLRRTRVFIPSTVFDNKKLLENDPGYLGTLASLPEAEKQALLYGDWDSFNGQVFTEWRNDPAHYEDQRWTHRPGRAGAAHQGSGGKRPNAARAANYRRGRPGYLQRESGREHCGHAGKAPELHLLDTGRPHATCRQDAAALPAGI